MISGVWFLCQERRESVQPFLRALPGQPQEVQRRQRPWTIRCNFCGLPFACQSLFLRAALGTGRRTEIGLARHHDCQKLRCDDRCISPTSCEQDLVEPCLQCVSPGFRLRSIYEAHRRGPAHLVANHDHSGERSKQRQRSRELNLVLDISD